MALTTNAWRDQCRLAGRGLTGASCGIAGSGFSVLISACVTCSSTVSLDQEGAEQAASPRLACHQFGEARSIQIEQLAIALQVVCHGDRLALQDSSHSPSCRPARYCGEELTIGLRPQAANQRSRPAFEVILGGRATRMAA